MPKVDARADVFQAIADPTRRGLLDLLGDGERAVHQLAAPFAASMSRPAISQHLQVLKEAGLVDERRVGRERLYVLRPMALREVDAWVRRYERFWRGKLAALGTYLDETYPATREEGQS